MRKLKNRLMQIKIIKKLLTKKKFYGKIKK